MSLLLIFLQKIAANLTLSLDPRHQRAHRGLRIRHIVTCFLQSVRQAQASRSAADNGSAVFSHRLPPVGFSSLFFALSERIHVSVFRSIASIWLVPDATIPLKIEITNGIIS